MGRYRSQIPEESALLTQEIAPVLSDGSRLEPLDIDQVTNTTSAAGKKKKKKRGWKRFFGGGSGSGNGNTSSKQQQQQQHQQQQHYVNSETYGGYINDEPLPATTTATRKKVTTFADPSTFTTLQPQQPQLPKPQEQQQQQQKQHKRLFKGRIQAQKQVPTIPKASVLKRRGPEAAASLIQKESSTHSRSNRSNTSALPHIRSHGSSNTSSGQSRGSGGTSSVLKNSRNKNNNSPLTIGGAGGSGSGVRGIVPLTSTITNNNNNNNKGEVTATSQQHVMTVLERPFGRQAVQPKNQVWIVQVLPAEWDPDQSIWKYRIQLQRRVTSNEEEILQELTHARTTVRSLRDFYWLEQALQVEYQGGILVPSLSISLGAPGDLEQVQFEVDSKLLTNWLSDVLNGIRGQGEWVLNYHTPSPIKTPLKEVNWLTSESMEAFLYRTDDLKDLDLKTAGAGPKSVFTAMNGGGGGDPTDPTNTTTGRSSTAQQVCGNDTTGEGGILQWVMNGEMCGLSSPNPATSSTRDDTYPMQYPVDPSHPSSTATTTSSSLSPGRQSRIRLPLSKQKVSSKALGDARSLNVQNSFVEHSNTFDGGNIENASTTQQQPLAQHTRLLQAERELVWSWRTRALQTMEKLRVLQEEEKQIGASWKRFAITLTNLFAYEKDIESARIGPTKSRKDLQMPYRKLQKSSVEDVLRILAKQKTERSTPALEFMGVMFSSYVADLAAVQTSMDAYQTALQDLSMQESAIEVLRAAKETAQAPSSSLTDQIQAGLDQVKKQLVAPLSEDGKGRSSAAQYESEEAIKNRLRLQKEELQFDTMKKRFRINEERLKENLTRLCKIVPVRAARMAFDYMQRETKQAGAIHGAAIGLKAKISVASKETLSKMISRHQTETKEDRTIELQLVQRMIHINNAKRFSKTDDGTEEVAKGIEINTDTENEDGALRDLAFQHCRERVGRWNAKVVLAIMEAVGVQDANVRVEETTRELRLVRKYAIGLRENVERCTEAIDALRQSITNGNLGDIRDIRQDLLWEMQTLFSGTYQPIEQPPTPLNIEALIEAGVPLSDPLGWRRKDEGCGGIAKAYLDSRDAGTEWLLTSLKELLKEYSSRVESVESFVYMECVGIQLEKHFSQQRADALAAFEKRTDITSAINIATRKRMPVLVKELQSKLETIGPDVSHTMVKEAKEAHLESKNLKQELHDLAMRRLTRSRETSTERVIGLMMVWSNEEETAASSELQQLKDFCKTLEKSIGYDELFAYLEAAPTTVY